MVVGINGGSSFPAVANPTLFERAAMALTGSITQVSATFLADPKTGNVAPAGTPELRQFAENYVEGYAQDSWRLLPSLTLTYRLRYGYETAPWGLNGLQ